MGTGSEQDRALKLVGPQIAPDLESQNLKSKNLDFGCDRAPRLRADSRMGQPFREPDLLRLLRLLGVLPEG